jgi:hypothetical protein
VRDNTANLGEQCCVREMRDEINVNNGIFMDDKSFIKLGVSFKIANR